MSATKRSFTDLEEEFCHACNIIQVMSDLLTVANLSETDLDDSTLMKLGFICFREAEKTRSIFYEALEHHSDKKSANK